MKNTQAMTITLDADALEALRRYQNALSAFKVVGHGTDEGAELFLATERAAEGLGKQVAALAPTIDGTPTHQILIVQDSLEVIDSARAVIAAMVDSLNKIIVRNSDTAGLEKARETAVASGQLKAMQHHGLLSMEKYSELMLEKTTAARNAGA